MGDLKQCPIKKWADLDNGNSNIAEDTYLRVILEILIEWLSMSNWSLYVKHIEKSQMTTTSPIEVRSC